MDAVPFYCAVEVLDADLDGSDEIPTRILTGENEGRVRVEPEIGATFEFWTGPLNLMRED